MRNLKSGKFILIVSCLAFCFSHIAVSTEVEQKEAKQKVEKTKKLYRVIDKNGNVSYSDEPSPGAIEMEMEEIPTVNITTKKIDFSLLKETTKRNSQSDADPYQKLVFLDLQQDGVIRNNSGTVTLTASLQPNIEDGHFLKFYIDGQIIGSQQKELTITAEKLEYGPHTASFVIVARNGSKIQESETVKFNLLHIVRNKSSNRNAAANNILNSDAFEVNLPKHPKVPSYESMKQSEQTDK